MMCFARFDWQTSLDKRSLKFSSEGRVLVKITNTLFEMKGLIPLTNVCPYN